MTESTKVLAPPLQVGLKLVQISVEARSGKKVRSIRKPPVHKVTGGPLHMDGTTALLHEMNVSYITEVKAHTHTPILAYNQPIVD